MDNSVFSDEFLTRIATVLDENIPKGSGKCMTRTDLSKALNLDKSYRLESALGALVVNGQIEGYEVRKGPSGGIGRIGEKPAKKITAPKPIVLTDEFKDRLMASLQKLCDNNGTPVTRKVIAKDLGDVKTLPMISAALKLPEFNEFQTKIGKGGGVRRVTKPVNVNDHDSDFNSDFEVNDMENEFGAELTDAMANIDDVIAI